MKNLLEKTKIYQVFFAATSTTFSLVASVAILFIAAVHTAALDQPRECDMCVVVVDVYCVQVFDVFPHIVTVVVVGLFSEYANRIEPKWNEKWDTLKAIFINYVVCLWVWRFCFSLSPLHTTARILSRSTSLPAYSLRSYEFYLIFVFLSVCVNTYISP